MKQMDYLPHTSQHRVLWYKGNVYIDVPPLLLFLASYVFLDCVLQKIYFQEYYFQICQVITWSKVFKKTPTHIFKVQISLNLNLKSRITILLLVDKLCFHLQICSKIFCSRFWAIALIFRYILKKTKICVSGTDLNIFTLLYKWH